MRASEFLIEGTQVNTTKQIYIWDELSQVSDPATRLSLAEAYVANNQNLLESNDPKTEEYFLSLSGSSSVPDSGKKYVTTLLGLANNSAMLLTPVMVAKFVKDLGNGFCVLEMADGTQSTYPDEKISNTMATKIFFFEFIPLYDKFRTIMTLKFDCELPNVDQSLLGTTS